MKRLLLLPVAAFAALGAISLIAHAQGNGESAQPSPVPGVPQPQPAASPVMQSAPADNGPAGSAASSVPLPAEAAPSAGPTPGAGIPLIPEAVQPRPESSGGGHETGGHRKGGGKGGGANLPSARPSPSGSPRETFAVEAGIRTRIQIRIAATQAVNDPAIHQLWVEAHDTKTDPDRRAILMKYYTAVFDRMIKIDPSITERVNFRRQATMGRLHYARLGDLLPDVDPYSTPPPAPSGVNPPLSDEPLPY